MQLEGLGMYIDNKRSHKDKINNVYMRDEFLCVKLNQHFNCLHGRIPISFPI